MTSSQGSDPVDAARDDIEATRSDLVETVTELSDRLDPKKRAAAVTHDVTTGAQQAVAQVQDVTRSVATKVQGTTKTGVARGKGVARGRESQIAAAAVAFLVFIVGWQIWKRR